MKSETLELLRNRLTAQKASLLLGAGFSYGAKNAGENDIPLGETLSKKLYQHFYVDCPPQNKSKEYCDSVKADEKNLKKLCTILSSEGRGGIRDIYLSKVFSGCHSAENPFHNKIKDYSWNKIFTLNIDDLVENIFAQTNTPLCKWNYSQFGECECGVQTLIKLHGDVQDIGGGFVFDEDEYTSFTLESNCLLKEFAACFLSGDMVILGTEFQESDLSFILKLYETSGYKKSGNQYFFVVPHLNDIILQNKIASIENFHWIEMRTQEFLEYVSDNVTEPESNRSLLKERGAIFLDEVEPKQNYTSKIYSGAYAEYNDLFDDWDIRYPGQQQLFQSIRSAPKNYLITFYGKAYCGKTTIAKRLLVDCKNSGYVAIELFHTRNNIIESLYTYLSNMQDGTRVAILIENAAYEYERIVTIAQKCASAVEHLIIITTDTMENHCGKNHLLNALPNHFIWKEIEITETINTEYAAKAFYTLCVKRRLNNYLKLIPPNSKPTDAANMQFIQDKMKKLNDIIDVLYYSSEGQYFREHYATWLKTKTQSKYIEYIYVLCVLNRLGISKIPTACLACLIPSKSVKFSLEIFLNEFSEILEEKNGHIKLLRGRVVADALPSLSSELVVTAIRQLVFYTLGLFDEGDDSEYYEIFQKALRIKRIRNHSILTHEGLNNLFTSLEESCRNISYYWIQYGIAAQLVKKFDEANNHFLYAKQIRPNSYQVAHALAKNSMETGLFQLENGISSSETVFNQGCQDMLVIISSPNYSHAFNFSVHSYANMLMKYYSRKKILIPDQECNQLNSYFKQVIQYPIDAQMKEIIISFYKYCQNNHITQYCNGLNSVWRIKPIATSHEDTDY